MDTYEAMEWLDGRIKILKADCETQNFMGCKVISGAGERNAIGLLSGIDELAAALGMKVIEYTFEVDGETHTKKYFRYKEVEIYQFQR